MRQAQILTLSDDQRDQLTRWAKGRRTPARLRLRARIVLSAAEGRENKDIAVALGCTRRTVGTWRKRFAAAGLKGIQDEAPRSGRKRSVRSRTEAEIIRRTTDETPPLGPVWSTRTLAKAMNVSEATVRRVWRDNNLHPRRAATEPLPRDPRFADELQECVGLYLVFPEHALALTSRESAWDPDVAARPMDWHLYRNHEDGPDFRWSTLRDLLSRLSFDNRPLPSKRLPLNRAREWIEFLDELDSETAADLQLHLLVDNYATLRNPEVQAWLQRHPRFHTHLTPPNTSWNSALIGWFRDICRYKIGYQFYRSAQQLSSQISSHAIRGTERGKLVWTKGQKHPGEKRQKLPGRRRRKRTR